MPIRPPGSHIVPARGSSAARGPLAILSLGLALALALAACGSNGGGGDATGGAHSGGNPGSSGGSPGSGGSASGGNTASGGQSGSGGMTASGGATSSSGGATSSSGGAASSGGATSSGGASASGGATASGGSPGSGGAGGAATGTGGANQGGGTGTAGRSGQAGAGGGAMSCAGNALSLATNGYRTGTSGANNDAAAARVDVDFGASSTDLPIANAFRTVEFWAYVPSNSWTGNANTLFFYGSTARPAHGFGLDFGTDAVANMSGNHATLDPYTNGGFDADSTNDLGISSSTSQWVHFAMTWDGKALRALVNGKEVITKMGDSGTTALNTDRSAITVGGYESDGNYFNGYIDEFRVWNVARTAAEITSTMNKTLVGDEMGLVLYLKFDESSGATAADSVTAAGHTAHNGALKSANSMPPTFIPSTAPVGCR